MLMPKKTKYRKSHRGRRKGNSKGGNTVNFGDYGIQAVETSYVTGRQIEAARITIMSVNDLRELSVTELKNKIVDLKKELMDSRFALATSQLEDTSVFKKIRKEIAQANTVLTEKLSIENVEEGE